MLFRYAIIIASIMWKMWLYFQDAPSELYGPLMLTFSLVAVLLYGMKSFGHGVVSVFT